MGNTDTRFPCSKRHNTKQKDLPSELDPSLMKDLSLLRLHNPDLKCRASGQSISKLCLNPRCRYSLRCSQLNCSSCGKEVHPLCSSVSLDELTEMINDYLDTCKGLTQELLKIDERMIQKIKMNQRDLVDNFTSLIFEKSVNRGVYQIYERRNAKGVTGIEASSICEWLREELLSVGNDNQNILSTYSRDVFASATQISRSKEQILKSLIEERRSNGCFSQISTTSSILKEEIRIFNSRILNMESSYGQEQFQFLMKQLDQPRRSLKAVNLELLFRASEHNFSAKAFHDHCDGIRDTLTLVRTQFGRNVAGYSEYKWDQVKSGSYLHKREMNAFLLQLDRREKMVPVRMNRLICCDERFGPIFGMKDLAIGDRCNLEKTSQTDFPCTFNREGSPYPPDYQESRQVFTGVQVGRRFLVEEYEVYRVVFQMK